ncbi:probable E3 ubiquitin-protein ligase RHA4A [Macadamia integrifolia]|uniref:probable E3 ubiquitin-protein ligase RHA4A n=1 Tax=Macadamia integrifolia TaxID=60698 RepID=UPI001C4E660B|nr:probable E3 ubiquitin-protein ligase RHA4A [Macadamia integrifolia]
MAGMLPGVELARRRRIHSSNQNDDYRNCRSDSFFRERLPPSIIATTTTTMDSTTLMARMRLEEKLGGFRSRWNKKHEPQSQPPPVQHRSSSHVLRPTQIHTSETRNRETEVCRSSPQLSRRNSQREVCSVCLDDLQGKREVTNLPCSHRYHSDCLLPWLASHSHCPYCRALVHL